MSFKKVVNQCKGIIAERAEKVFLTHMEIIRLKYPGTLHALSVNQQQDGRFSIWMKVDRDVILQGLGIFLPYGSDLRGDVQISSE